MANLFEHFEDSVWVELSAKEYSQYYNALRSAGLADLRVLYKKDSDSYIIVKPSWFIEYAHNAFQLTFLADVL